MTFRLSLAAFLVLSLCRSLTHAQSSARYDSPRTTEIMSRMAETHGSYDEFIDKPSIDATFAMYLHSLDLDGDARTWKHNWRYYQIVIEPSTSTGYVMMPHEDLEGPATGFDGETMWTLPIELDPSFRDSPFMLHYYHYGMVMLPFLAQMPEARYTYAGTEELPGYPVDHHIISITYQAEGINHPGEVKLWIDPVSYIVRAYGSTTRFPLFPGGNIDNYDYPGSDRMIRLFESHTRLDGLLVPRSYVTMGRGLLGGFNAGGFHLMPEFSAHNPFDKSKTEMPEGAAVSM